MLFPLVRQVSQSIVDGLDIGGWTTNATMQQQQLDLCDSAVVPEDLDICQQPSNQNSRIRTLGNGMPEDIKNVGKMSLQTLCFKFAAPNFLGDFLDDLNDLRLST